MRVKKVDLDQYWRQLFEPLRSTPPMDAQLAAEERNKFLFDGAALRSEEVSNPRTSTSDKTARKPKNWWASRPLPWSKVLIGLVLAIIILASSSATVFASQTSLPGEPLYIIKSWSEDFRLSVANSPQTKLELTLTYTERRVDEIASLIEEGEDYPSKALKRFESEMENALQIAAQMGDEQMISALQRIKVSAQNQGMTMEELVNRLPEQATPAIVKFRERIEEQVRLSRMGEEDPQAFRYEIRERHRNEQGNPKSNQPDNSLKIPISTRIPTQNPNKPGNNPNNDNGMPGNSNPGPGGGKSTQEGGKNDPTK